MLDNVPVFSLWFELVGWILDHTAKFPKNVRMSFALKIDRLVLNILEDIVRASYSREQEKSDYLQKINLDLNVLRVLLRLALNRKYIASHAHEYASQKIDEAGKMIGGWQRFTHEKSERPF